MDFRSDFGLIIMQQLYVLFLLNALLLEWIRYFYYIQPVFSNNLLSRTSYIIHKWSSLRGFTIFLTPSPPSTRNRGQEILSGARRPRVIKCDPINKATNFWSHLVSDLDIFWHNTISQTFATRGLFHVIFIYSNVTTTQCIRVRWKIPGCMFVLKDPQFFMIILLAGITTQ